MGEAGFNNSSSVTEQQLDEIVQSIKRDHPNDGEVLIQGHLLRMGIRVPRHALRSSIHRIDNIGAVSRRRSVVRRRVYSVPYPNFIWHIDGHHKLVRWRFVIHGAIDGFSRTITYLHFSNNNRASTVLDLFQSSVALFSLPDHIRTDHGGENVDIWRYMIANHDHNYSCVITGSSVHNERVERLWRDVNRCVCSIFADAFRTLERNGLFDTLNEVDLYCLHYIYLPRINRCLNEFKESWNHHSISTEGCQSPYQLFFEGVTYMNQTHNYNLRTYTNIDVSQITGEWVTIPRLLFVPCSSLMQDLSCINPLQSCSDNGISLYKNAIELMGQHLILQCNNCHI